MAKEKESKNQKHFFKDFKAELKKVIWPTPKQLVNSTLAVIAIVLFTTLIVFVLDLAFSFLNDNVLNKFKNNIKNSNVVIEQNVTNSNTVDDNTTANNLTENEQTVENTINNTVE